MDRVDAQGHTEQLAQLCRDCGLKVTPQRMAVLSALIGTDAHPTADMVFQQIRDRFPGLSFDTVNRSLQTFVQTGLLDIVEGQGGARRFDPNTVSHHHFLCRHCGDVIDFECDVFDRLEVPAEIGRKHKVLKKRVVIHGVCERCLTGHP